MGGPGEAGASGGPGSSGGPGAKDSASGGPGAAKAAADGASGGPGGKKKDDDDLVDPDADRPNFGSLGENDEEEAAEEASAMSMARAGRGGATTAAKRKAERKPVDPAYVTVAVMALAVAALGGMIWLGRDILMQAWPQVAGFYQRAGIEPAKPGDGLRISESSKRLQRIGGVETLMVRGFISNIAEIPKTAPGLTLQRYNEKKEVIQDTSINPPSGLLDPQGSSEFEIRMELPQLNAAKGGYGVVWTPAE